MAFSVISLATKVACMDLHRGLSPLLTQCRGSLYGPRYIKPIVSHQELDEAEESGYVTEMGYKSIKAALNQETCSVFYDVTLEKFLCIIGKYGQKNTARAILAEAFENVKCLQLEKYRNATPEERTKIELNPLKILHHAIENCTPIINLMPIRRGGRTYQVPTPVKSTTARFMAMRWLRDAGKTKFQKGSKRIPWSRTFANEMIDASLNKGLAVKAKQDLHRQCEANRAYAHYRWA